MVKTHVFFLLLFIFPGTLCDEHEYQEMFSIVQNKMRVEFEEIWKHQATQDKRIHELELMIENQNKQIRNLKRRCTDKEKDYIYKLFKEDSQIINPNFESEQLVGPKHNQSDVLKTQTTEIKTSLTYRRHLVNNEIQDRDYYRKRRQMNTDPVNTVAFYAYMSTHETNPGRHQTLIFDMVKTNLGSSYSKHTGVFSAPEHGTYVFTWTITSGVHSFIYSEIVINSVPFGSIVTDSDEIHDHHSATGIIVVQLNHGDVVYIRTNPNISIKGQIMSQSLCRSSFSGWKIM